MRSGGGVLCIAAAQLLLGFALLGIYEGYKSYYYGKFISNLNDTQSRVAADFQYESPLNFRWAAHGRLLQLRVEHTQRLLPAACCSTAPTCLCRTSPCGAGSTIGSLSPGPPQQQHAPDRLPTA